MTSSESGCSQQLGDRPLADLGERAQRALDEVELGQQRLVGRSCARDRPRPTLRRRQRSSSRNTPAMPCGGCSSSRAMRLRRSGGTLEHGRGGGRVRRRTSPAPAPAVSPVGPEGHDLGVARGRRGRRDHLGGSDWPRRARPGAAPAAGRRRGRHGPAPARAAARPRRGARRRALVLCAAGRGRRSARPLLACSRPGACSSTSRAAARSTGHGRGCQPGRASRAARAVSRCSASSTGNAVRAGRRYRSSSDLAPLALGLLEQLAGDGHALVPMLGGGPAIVDDQQQRPAAAEARRRVQHRAGQRQDQQGRHDAGAAAAATRACAPGCAPG